MSLASLLKGLKAALPIILANAPVFIDAVREVKKAVKKEARPQIQATEPAS